MRHLRVPWRLIAVVVVLVLLGVGVWRGAVYLSSGARQGAGVPLFKADAQPFKHRPAHPGGEQPPYQDSTVFNTLNESSGKAESAGYETLLPEPEQPVKIDGGHANSSAAGTIDVGSAQTTGSGVTASTQAGTQAGSGEAAGSKATVEQNGSPALSSKQVSAIVKQMMNAPINPNSVPVPGEKPQAPPAPTSSVASAATGTGTSAAAGTNAATATGTNAAASTGAATGSTAATQAGNKGATSSDTMTFADVAAALDSGTSSSTGSQPAASSTSSASAAGTANSGNASSATTQASAPSSAGVIRVQIAAFSSRGAATAAWQRLVHEQADLLGKLQPRVVETTIAGTTFHRLQVGAFSDRAQAQALCDALKKRSIDCLVVGP